MVGGSRVHSQDVTDRIEFQLPDGEHHTRGEVRGGLTVSLPPPGFPPVYIEVGAGYEEEAVVMIPDRRDNGEAGKFAPDPNVLPVGGWVEINVVPGIGRGAANRPIERGVKAPPGPRVSPRQHPVLRSAEENSVENGGLPLGGKGQCIGWDAADGDNVAVIERGADNVFPVLHGSRGRGI